MVLFEPWHDMETPRVDTSRVVSKRDLLPTTMSLPGGATAVVVLNTVDADAGEPDGLVSAGG